MATAKRPKAQKLKKPEQQAVQLFQHRWDIAHKAMQPRFAYFREMQAVYDGLDDIPETIRQRLEAEVKIPWAKWNWNTVLPRLADPAPRLDFRPAGQGKEQIADVCKVVIRTQMEQGHFVLEQLPLLHDAGIFGIGISQVLWHQRAQTALVRQPLTPEQREAGEAVEPTFIQQTQIVENWAKSEWVDPFDFFPDPKAINDQTWAWVFHRVWLSTADLQARAAEGVYRDVDCCNLGGSEEDAEGRPGESPEEAEARRQGKHAVITMWGKDGTKIVMCGDVLLELGRNHLAHQQIPFVCFSTKPRAKSLFGESEMEVLRDLQLNTWVSDTLRRDAYLRAQNTGVIADPGITVPKRRGPGFVIRAMQGQRFDEIKFDANQGPSMTESENMLGAMQEMSGAAGVAGFSNPSDLNRMAATVGGIAQEESNMGMLFKKLWFRLATARIAKFMVQLNHQYLSEMELHRICGSTAVGYKPPAIEEIPMFLDVLPEALSQQLSILADRNSNIELLNIVGPLNGQQMHDGSVFTTKPVLEDTLKSYQRDVNRHFHHPMPTAINPMTGAPMDPSMGMMGAGMAPVGNGMPGMPPQGQPMMPAQQQAAPLPGPAEDVHSMMEQPV